MFTAEIFYTTLLLVSLSCFIVGGAVAMMRGWFDRSRNVRNG